MASNNNLKDFFKNKNFFITGGTGFIGITMVEKLLRTFPKIGKIYLLVRPKRGVSSEERKKTFFNNVVFDRLKKDRNIETLSKKVYWMEGDIYMQNLGISEENLRKMENEINVIIHCAAEINFALPLKHLIVANVGSTYDLLKIADKCKKLNSFVYISTLYCQVREGETHTTEDTLKTKYSPLKLLKLAQELTTEEFETQAKAIIENYCDYYGYSKTSAENMCLEFEGRFLIAIFRPGMVCHSYAEPKPHYIGNNLGFPRILFEANRGYVLCCHPEVNTNVIPVDITSNSILAVLWKTSQNRIMKVKVYNSTTKNNPHSVSDAYRYYSNSIPDYETVLVPHRYRLMEMDNAPSGSLEEKMQKKIKRFELFYDVLKYSSSFIKLTYDTVNLDAILWEMNDEERALLSFDIRVCDWKKYYTDMVANQFGLEKFPEFEDLAADPKKRIDARERFIAKIKSKY